MQISFLCSFASSYVLFSWKVKGLTRPAPVEEEMIKMKMKNEENEEMIKINKWHVTSPLCHRERLLKDIRSFRTRSSLSQFAPKFESARTKVWVTSHPSHGSILTWFLLFLSIRNTSCASAWTDFNCCVKQGSRVMWVLEAQRKLCCVYLKYYCLALGKCYIFLGKVYCLWPRLTSVRYYFYHCYHCSKRK